MASLAMFAGKAFQEKSTGVFKITPRLALAATGLILAAARLWVGFAQKPGTQDEAHGAADLIPVQTPLADTGWGLETAGLAMAAPGPAGTALADPGVTFALQGRDNVSVLAFSGAVMDALTMALLAYGRYRGAAPGDSGPRRAIFARQRVRRPSP